MDGVCIVNSCIYPTLSYSLSFNQQTYRTLYCRIKRGHMMSKHFWYQSGDIPEAIRLSKQQSKLFLVYVTGKDEASHQMDQYWNNETVISICKKSCIALKLQANSNGCNQFSAIYPVLCIPSAYFIDNSGRLVEALVAQSSIEEFVAKVKNVTMPYITGEASLSSHDNTNICSTSPQSSSAAENVGDKSALSRNQINDANHRDALSNDDNNASSKSASGSNPGKPNPPRSDEDVKASEEVSNQLKQYRTAIAKHFDREADEKEKALQHERLIQTEAKEKEAREKHALRQSRCRLQFRLPDGAAIIQTFKSDELFLSAVNYIKSQNLPPLENRSFTLSQVYPRKNYTGDDYSKTFQQLDMVPGASLVVIPSNETEHVASSSTLNSLLSLLMFLLLLPYKIFLQLWNFVIPQSQSPANVAAGSESGNPHVRFDGRRSDVSNANIRRRYTGNMARLSDAANDDDDDNATWNGNSTQQM